MRIGAARRPRPENRNSDMDKIASQPTLSERADALEDRMIAELNINIAKSVLFMSGERDPTKIGNASAGQKPGTYWLQSDDPRLPKKPTLFDFFKYRFASANHVLQSARLALKAGHHEKIVIACLLHDIANAGFIRSDHGWWGAQLVEPYVDEEVSWAIRAHQALRFFPDESAGYSYPEQYIRLFGPDFK